MPLIRSQTTHAQTSPDAEVLRFSDADPLKRAALAHRLGLTQGNSPALIAQLEVEQELLVVSALMTALAQQQSADAVQALIDCLESEQAWLRSEAVEALKLLVNDHYEQILVALENTEPDVQLLLLTVLENLRVKVFEEYLLQLLLQDAPINVCAGAINLLCEMATENAIEALVYTRQRFIEEDYFVFAIDLALKVARGAKTL